MNTAQTLLIPFSEYTDSSMFSELNTSTFFGKNTHYISKSCISSKKVVPLHNFSDYMLDSTNISKDVTFVNSMNIPFQRWYPYIEGYSPNFVLNIIKKYCPDTTLIYEPFAGTGTTLFAADSIGCDCVYSEINPLLRYIIETKFRVLSLSQDQRTNLGSKLQDISSTIINELSQYKTDPNLSISYQQTFGSSKYFSDDTYAKILSVRTYIDQCAKKDKILSDLLTLALLSSLVPVSFLKRQGDVRFKNEKELSRTPNFANYFPERIRIVAQDLLNYDYQLQAHQHLICNNAKDIGLATTIQKFSSVITSPPYLNGTNYFRNTKLELWFLRYLQNQKDLRRFRDAVLTSGINDVKLHVSKTYDINDPLLEQTLLDLRKNSYDKRIQKMVSCYFDEMMILFDGLKKHLANGACVAIDIGDSIFAGVHVKTDDILVNILSSIGYILEDKVLLRNRRSHNGQLLSQVLLVFRYRE